MKVLVLNSFSLKQAYFFFNYPSSFLNKNKPLLRLVGLIQLERLLV